MPAAVLVVDDEQDVLDGIRRSDTVRIMLTGHADTATAIRAINEGELYRFLAKPCDRAELLVALHLACEKAELERENRRLLALIRTDPELLARFERERPGVGDASRPRPLRIEPG